MKRKNEKDHHNRKSEGSAEVWRKQKKAQNAARPKQRWNEPPALTADEIEALTLEELDARRSQRGWTREDA